MPRVTGRSETRRGFCDRIMEYGCRCGCELGLTTAPATDSCCVSPCSGRLPESDGGWQGSGYVFPGPGTLRVTACRPERMYRSDRHRLGTTPAKFYRDNATNGDRIAITRGDFLPAASESLARNPAEHPTSAGTPRGNSPRRCSRASSRRPRSSVVPTTVFSTRSTATPRAMSCT